MDEQKMVSTMLPSIDAETTNLDEISQQNTELANFWHQLLDSRADLTTKIDLINKDGEQRLYGMIAKSTRPGVDWQLTMFDKSQQPTSHLDISEANREQDIEKMVQDWLPSAYSNGDSVRIIYTESQLKASVDKVTEPVIPNIKITDEMILKAKKVSIIDAAEKNGIELKRDRSGDYRGVVHDSLVVSKRGNVFSWFSRSISGDSIKFMQDIVGVKDFKQAVVALNDPELKPFDQAQTIEMKEPFDYYIENSTHSDRARQYLTIARGINPVLVDQLHNKGSLQQDVEGNAIFIWGHNGKKLELPCKARQLIMLVSATVALKKRF